MLDAFDHAQEHPRQHGACDHAANHGEEEDRRDGCEGKAARRGGQRDAIDQERTRIVQQALALEHGHEAHQNRPPNSCLDSPECGMRVGSYRTLRRRVLRRTPL